MKNILLILALVTTIVAAGPLDEQIAKLESEIAQQQTIIDQMKSEGKPTGRFEMVVWRLKNDLQKLKDLNG